MHTSFEDKTIWITGASSGIGEALAMLLAMSGARLVLSGRDTNALACVAGKCADFSTSKKVSVESFDLSAGTDFSKIVEQVLCRTGGVDILINNAGVGQRASALSCDPSVVRRIMEVNFFGSVFLTQAILPSMIDRGSGRIVVVSSVLGKFHMPGRSAYSASKHALRGYFDTLRAELYGSGVEITVVYPGWIATRISQNALTADGTAYSRAFGKASRKMSAEACASRIVAAMSSGAGEAAMGGVEIFGGWFRTLFPKLYDRSMREKAKAFVYTRTKNTPDSQAEDFGVSGVK